MKKLKYLIILFLITAINFVNISNGNENNKKPIIVLADINAMGRIIDTIKWPYLNTNINDGKILENEKIKNFANEIIADGDSIEISNRKNPHYIIENEQKDIYDIFAKNFNGGKGIIGRYADRKAFFNDYKIFLEQNNNSLSNTLKVLVKNTLIDGKNKALVNDGDLINNIWANHAAYSINNKLMDLTSKNRSVFVFLPPKLSTNYEYLSFMINVMKPRYILRLKDETNFLFEKTIMPNQNVYNILIDGHHTNHIKTAKNLVNEKDKSIVVANNVDGYKQLSNYLDSMDLIDNFKTIVNEANDARNLGIDKTCMLIKQNNKDITLKSALATTFENELFKNRNNYNVNTDSTINIFNNL